MISVHEATEIILNQTLTLPTEQVPLSECNGRVLREDLIADRDFPPFDRVTMDGIAIDYDSFVQGNKRFAIQEIAAAGSPQTRLHDPILCIEVMTGAVLPSGCDTVIRYEDVLIAHQKAEVILDTLVQGQNIHQRGIDRKQGNTIVKKGMQLSAAEIGVAATVGKSVLQVGSLPKIAVISTGDELVAIDATPLPHQIRKSNVHQISSLLEQHGVSVKCYHFADDAKEVEESLKKILTEYDTVILSGGVSAGKYDYVPEALEKLGVEKLFHQVAQRPGKPFWFGVKKEDQHSEARGLAFRQAQRPVSEPVEERTEDWRLRTVFALPGNPVSTFMCTIRYIVPWLEKTLGISHRQQFAILSEDVTFKPSLTYFLQVKLEHHRDGRLRAHPIAGHGSGDLANLVEADAFLELEGSEHIYHQGGSFRVWRFRE